MTKKNAFHTIINVQRNLKTAVFLAVNINTKLMHYNTLRSWINWMEPGVFLRNKRLLLHKRYFVETFIPVLQVFVPLIKTLVPQLKLCTRNYCSKVTRLHSSSRSKLFTCNENRAYIYQIDIQVENKLEMTEQNIKSERETNKIIQTKQKKRKTEQTKPPKPGLKLLCINF